MYLHPHAQRGLMRMFREIADGGTQILYSTHSSAFVDIERFDEVVIVDRCPDAWDEELCTTVRTLSARQLVERHRKNRPGEDIRIDGIRERYRHACGAEHTEALFARVVVLAEGATEAACLSMYADAMDVNFDALGVSVVNARGKDSIESLYHVYAGLGFPVFVIFDNDVGKPSSGSKERERRQVSNRRLTRLLIVAESDAPAGGVWDRHAIMDRDFENVLRREVEAMQTGLFDKLTSEAAALYGTESKPIAARHIASHLCELDWVPPTVRMIVGRLAALAGKPLADNEPAELEEVIDDLDLPF